jgi:hypothetical protein
MKKIWSTLSFTLIIFLTSFSDKKDLSESLYVDSFNRLIGNNKFASGIYLMELIPIDLKGKSSFFDFKLVDTNEVKLILSNKPSEFISVLILYPLELKESEVRIRYVNCLVDLRGDKPVYSIVHSYHFYYNYSHKLKKYLFSKEEKVNANY